MAAAVPPAPAPAAALRWPVVNPGNSWAVPRISMPDFFSIQWDFGLESWCYGGHALDDDGNAYSLNVYFGRAALDPAIPALQGAALGFGIGIGATGDYHMCSADGLGVSEDPAKPAVLTVPPVGDSSYSLAFAAGAGASATIRFVGGAAVGMAGARYRLDVEGTGAAGEAMTLGLDLVDELGTRMEGYSGYVGPPVDPTGLYTYEVCQPRLRITGGSLSVGDRQAVLTGGSLWHDRQTYNVPPSSGSPPPAPPPPKAAASKPLYCGTWMPLLFDDGLTATISSNWLPVAGTGTQWIAGRASGAPPVGGTGNLYLADAPGQLNGGAMLRAVGEAGDPWGFDFDINIFDPQNPASSPSWTSPVDGVTYCTKWAVTFSDRLAAQWGVPRRIYLVALVPGCEFTPQGQAGFWEGATTIYADRECTRRIGRGWAEQMGYN